MKWTWIRFYVNLYTFYKKSCKTILQHSSISTNFKCISLGAHLERRSSLHNEQIFLCLTIILDNASPIKYLLYFLKSANYSKTCVKRPLENR